MNPQVLRWFWPLLVPAGMWLCGLLLVEFSRNADKRTLRRILLWTLPVFADYTAWVIYLIVMLLTHAI